MMNTSTTNADMEAEVEGLPIKVEALEANGITPTTIVRTNEKWYVKQEWNVPSSQVETLDGTWRIHGYLEGIGPSQEMVLWDETLPVEMGKTSYSMTTPIDLGKVYMGTYRLICVIQHSPKNGLVSPIAFYDDSLVLQFYDSGIRI